MISSIITAIITVPRQQRCSGFAPYLGGSTAPAKSCGSSVVLAPLTNPCAPLRVITPPVSRKAASNRGIRNSSASRCSRLPDDYICRDADEAPHRLTSGVSAAQYASADISHGSLSRDGANCRVGETEPNEGAWGTRRCGGCCGFRRSPIRSHRSNRIQPSFASQQLHKNQHSRFSVVLVAPEQN